MLRSVPTALFVFVIACGGVPTAAPMPAAAGHDSVTVENNSFLPRVVQPDSTGVVVWTWNSDGVLHDIKFEGPIGGAAAIGSGGFRQRFLTPGRYRYRCTLHSVGYRFGMTGVVVVPGK